MEACNGGEARARVAAPPFAGFTKARACQTRAPALCTLACRAYDRTRLTRFHLLRMLPKPLRRTFGASSRASRARGGGPR